MADKLPLVMTNGQVEVLQSGDHLPYAAIQDVSATDKVLGRSSTGAGVIEEIPCTAFSRGLLAAANAGAAGTLLGGILYPGNNLSDLASAATARGNLGLGSLATQSGTFSGTSSGTHSGTSSGTNTGDQAFPFICNARLSTESAVPVSTSDRTAQSTLYIVPFKGNLVAVYNTGTSVWELLTITTQSLTLTGLTSGKNYDVFLYSSGGTPTLALSSAWTSDTARQDAIALQDGVYVLSSDHSRRYLGTIRTTGTTTTEDSAAKRFVWNHYNDRPRKLLKVVSASYTYASTIRQINGDGTAQVEFVIGLTGDATEVNFSTRIETNVDEHGTVDIGENSTSAGASNSSNGQLRDFTATGTDNKRLTVVAQHTVEPRLGYTAFTMLETATSGTVQWFGGTIRGLLNC